MRCPGQDTRYWGPGDIFEVDCPNCGGKVEFFKDEARRKCGTCKQTVLNPKMDFGCAAYCRYAAECLGEMGPDLAGRRDDLLKDRVSVEVKRRLGDDFRRIAHGVKVARFAELLGNAEKVALAPLLSAAFLHLLWEEKGGGGSRDAVVQGERDAREVLEALGAREELMEKTMDLIRAFLSGENGLSPEGAVFSDAHQLALLEERGADAVTGGRNWRTGTGRALSEKS